MLKFTLFILAALLLASVAWGGDITGIGRSPLGKAPPTALSPSQYCRSQKYHLACSATSRKLCSDLQCKTTKGKVLTLGKAPDDMWCGPRQVCRNGLCVVQNGIPEPTDRLPFATCPN